MAVTNSILAFNAGEISPLLEGRVDLDKYSLSCREMENWRPTKYGAATKRPGTEYVAETKDSSKKSRLLKFQFSTSASYAIEAGNLYLRFFDSSGQVTVPSATAWATSTAYVVGDTVSESGNTYYCLVAHTSGTFATDLAAAKWVLLGVTGDPFEVTTPWSDTDVFNVHYAQINDIVYLVHPDHPVYKLSRLEDYYWTCEEVVWDFPALRTENIDDTLTITPSAKTGTGISLTASADVFESEHVGGYWYIEHRTQGTSTQLDISGSSGTTNSASVRLKGEWQLTTSERWYGTLKVERSKTGAFAGEEEVIREFKSDSDRNVSITGEESEKVYLRLEYTATGDPYGTPFQLKRTDGGTPSAQDYTYFEAQATLEAAEQYLGGVVKIATVTDAQNATGDVIVDLEGTTATEYWAEGAWSDYRGFPRTVALFEQRLVFAGNDSQKQTLWFSQIDDYENFEIGSGDTDSMRLTIGSQEYNEILWIIPQTRLLIGTSGGEYSIGSSDPETPLTPTSLFVRRQSNYGSSNLQAVMVNEVVLFVQRQGRKVREMAFSFEKDGYVAPDMTMLSEHITEGGVTTLAYQQQPDAILWATRSDGELLGMTYEREENVVGWFRWVTDGSVESVVALYGDSTDDLWVTVKRTINGATKRYVERFATQDFSTVKEDMKFMDSSLSFDGGDAVSVEGLTNARPAVVTVTGHAFENDQQVRLTGTGVPEADGNVYTVKNKTANTFQLYDSTGADPWDLRPATQYSPLPWPSGFTIYDGGQLVTLTFTSHHFVAGDLVEIDGGFNDFGVSNSGPYTETMKFAVTAVTATTITFPTPALQPPAFTYTVDFAGRNVYLPNGATAYSGGGTVERVENTFVNLSHLEGKTVTALVDGATTPTKTVSSGSVTLDNWGNQIHIGLPFTATLKPQKMSLSTQTGSSIGKTLRISEVTLRLYKTLGLKIGESATLNNQVIFRDTNDNMDDSPPLFTGDQKHYFKGTSNKAGDIVLLSEDPLPATILAMFPKVEVTG